MDLKSSFVLLRRRAYHNQFKTATAIALLRDIGNRPDGKSAVHLRSWPNSISDLSGSISAIPVVFCH